MEVASACAYGTPWLGNGITPLTMPFIEVIRVIINK